MFLTGSSCKAFKANEANPANQNNIGQLLTPTDIAFWLPVVGEVAIEPSSRKSSKNVLSLHTFKTARMHLVECVPDQTAIFEFPFDIRVTVSNDKTNH